VNHFIRASRFSVDVRVDNYGVAGANAPFDNGASRHLALPFTPALARRHIARDCAAAAAKAGVHGESDRIEASCGSEGWWCRQFLAGAMDICPAAAAHFFSMVKITA